MKKIIPLLFAVLSPTIVLAQTIVDDSGDGVFLENPLGDTTITGFLLDIMDVIMIFAIPIIVIMIIYAGFLYVMAQGNEAQISKAHKALLYAIVGGVIVLTADILLAVIEGTVDAFRT